VALEPRAERAATETRDESSSALLRRFLEQHDAPCPVCGYSLRNLTSERCPECGARLELRVGSMDLRIGKWIALVLAFALPAGLGLLPVAVIWTYVYLVGGLHELDEVISNSWPLLLLGLFSGGLLWVAIAARRRFWSLSSRRQTRWLLAGMVVSILLLLACLQLMNG
jgi:hypothetical protein